MSNVVIGAGLLAKAFKKSESNGCVFFCSGVSNSNEERINEFEREEILLRYTITENPGLKFVYFSSILADSSEKVYFAHKRNMEKLINSACTDYVIFRLPQVAGRALNNTLFPSFVRAICYETEINVFQNATRNIVDVDDVVRVFDVLFKNGLKNKIINVCSKASLKPIELIRILERELGKKAKVKLIQKASFQDCNCKELDKYLEYDDLLYKHDYVNRVVLKYLKHIVSLLQKERESCSEKL